MSFAPTKRKIEGLRVRKLDGKIVLPVLYNGKHVGHGKYFAASVNGELLLDENNQPLFFREVGELVDA